MKLLHTSDWHVGKGLKGISRTEEHREVLSEVIRIAKAEQGNCSGPYRGW
jgi:DNA repair protein SbcD/Mre11